MTAILRTVFDYFLFTSLFIAGCALLMVHQSYELLHLQFDFPSYLLFVFFSTICSYNFHWYLTPDTPSENYRVVWTQLHKMHHLVLAFIGLIGAGWYFFYFIQHWLWLSGAAMLTFLYSAPKVSVGPFAKLRKIAVGKTIFLAFVWTYVTTVLPVALDGQWHNASTLFIMGRFFLIYAICIPFDYRDREYDRKEGIRSMITYFNETGVNVIFYLSLTMYVVCSVALRLFGFSYWIIACLLAPALILLALYPVVKKNFSDYLYYFVLDGLMMFSALLTAFLPF